MSIEQEFFKTFEIDMKEHIDYECTCIQWQPTNCTKEDMIDCSSCEKHKYLKYPKITAEIVLKLEEVIRLSLPINYTLGFCSSPKGHFRYELIKFKNGLGSICNSIHDKTRTEALLSLCIKLNDQIKEAVQEVFV